MVVTRVTDAPRRAPPRQLRGPVCRSIGSRGNERVDGFSGAARRHTTTEPRKVEGVRVQRGLFRDNSSTHQPPLRAPPGDPCRCHHRPSGPLRGNDEHPSSAQDLEVLLHGGVFPHFGMHGRAEDDRCLGGDQGGTEQVGGAASSVVGNDPRRCGTNHNAVSGLAEVVWGSVWESVPQRCLWRL